MKQNNQDGIALLSVFWALIILSLMATTVLSLGKTNRMLSQNGYQYDQANYSADAAVNYALYRLVKPGTASSIPDGVTDFNHQFQGDNIEINLIPEEGKIDLNSSDVIMISGLLAYYGLNEIKARKIEEWITEQRKSENIILFHSVDDLARLPDFPAKIYNCIEPYLTVYSRRNGVDLSLATPAMIDYVNWADLKRWGGESWLNTDGSSKGQYVSGLDQQQKRRKGRAGRAYTIVTNVNIGEKLNITRRAIVRITGNRRESYWVYDRALDYTDTTLNCEHL